MGCSWGLAEDGPLFLVLFRGYLDGSPWASCKRPQRPQRLKALGSHLDSQVCLFCIPVSQLCELLVGRDWVYHVGGHEQLTAGAQEMLEFYVGQP